MESKASALGALPKLKLWTVVMESKASALGALPKLKLWTPKSFFGQKNQSVQSPNPLY